MMKLTAKQGRGTKMHLYIDGDYRFTVSRDFWLSCGAYSGQELDDEELCDLRERAEHYAAKQRAYRILAQREHSQKELEDKLSRSFSRELARQVTDEMLDFGYIHDDEYAKMLVRELSERKKFGAARIRMELKKRGVGGDDIEEAMALLEEEDFRERIVQLLETKFSRDLDTEKGRRKVFSSLMRLGYRSDDIRGAMRDYLSGEFNEFSE